MGSASDEQQQNLRDKLREERFEPIEEEGEQPDIDGPSRGGNMLAEMFNFPTPESEVIANRMSAAAADYRLPTRSTAAVVADSSGDWYGSNWNNRHLMQGLNSDSAVAMHVMDPTHHLARSTPPHPPTHQAFHEPSSFGGVVEGQGLSLSLSSSLEMAKADQELRLRDGVLYFNNQLHHHQQHQLQQLSLQLQGQSEHMGDGVNVLRNSKYARAAQELVEEFCSVRSTGQIIGSRIGRHHASSSSNPNYSNPNPGGGGSIAAAGSSSSSKVLPPLSPAETFELQRKKAKLLSIFDEVGKRYNQYCDQMQMVVNSFDSVMGFGAALPYTALAQKAMSRHFRCLKDAIAKQLKQTRELLGEKEEGSRSAAAKVETPRLRLLDQSLRQQRAFHLMGMVEQEAWRPQRGLPEHSVTILRAWLFERFLHPYPSDADKLFLARQTGLSRNQVANWFINARVRLWKPMVEAMYQQEAKEGAKGRRMEEGSHQRAQSPRSQGHKPETNMTTSDPSPTYQRYASEIAQPLSVVLQQAGQGNDNDDLSGIGAPDHGGRADVYGTTMTASLGPAGMHVTYGLTGDVSLTLGLRHAGSAVEKNLFRIRDYEDF